LFPFLGCPWKQFLKPQFPGCSRSVRPATRLLKAYQGYYNHTATDQDP
jgi:hypothetical protein